MPWHSARPARSRGRNRFSTMLIAVVGSSRNPSVRRCARSSRHTRALVAAGSPAVTLPHQGPDGRAALMCRSGLRCATRRPEWVPIPPSRRLIGLAADNLGLRRFDASTRAARPRRRGLGVARRGAYGRMDRRGPAVALRWHWVSAERALRGDPRNRSEAGPEAQRLAADCPSTHHRIKAAHRRGRDRREVVISSASPGCSAQPSSTTPSRAETYTAAVGPDGS